MSSGKLTAHERRAQRRAARSRMTELRAKLRAAYAARNERVREIRKAIRAERLALRDRLRENRRRFLEELRAWERDQRAEARATWKRRRAEVKASAASEIERVRAEMALTREHASAVRHIKIEAEERALAHERALHTDEHVVSSIAAELIPLFERVKASIHAGHKTSRAEVFLRLAEKRPNEVLKIIEPHIDQIIRETILALSRSRRGGADCGCVHPPFPAKAANGNGLTGGGPLPAEVERIRLVESRAEKKVKGEGLDTAGIAKAIREDIKEAVRRGELPKGKYSVRTDRYSMGSSITIVVSKLPFRTLNPDAYRVEDGSVMFDRTHFQSRFTPEAQAVERRLEAIIDAYHWDRSDLATDYYNERFARDVRMTEDGAEWKKIEAAKLAAARGEEART
jgi:hypothetical protein